MKRTAEVVLGIIGALAYGFLAVIGGIIVWLQSNEDVARGFYDDMMSQSPELELPDYQVFLDSFGTTGIILLIGSILAIAVGVVAMVLLRGNKKPKVAGIMFIVTAVLVAVISLGTGVIAGAFYLIAGIMCLVRKPKQLIV
ncbi:DUF4064 domain-containing protein [Paraliobacillus sp. X-1268]|uniref:DUF4064 domain-containing protein n=1 Tax=Paraliobacillus sp. X-1268 TaxID=2213193 RepID=UPI000E3C174A|nr:DUF4064 domain-containing protein [Paraliobacillus sp. X-1268]